MANAAKAIFITAYLVRYKALYLYQQTVNYIYNLKKFINLGIHNINGLLVLQPITC